MASEPSTRLTALSDVLWRQRELLDLLRFKLDEERLLLRAGRGEWVLHAAREVELVLDRLHRAEMARVVAVAEVAASLELGPRPTLAMVAAAAPAPWSGLLQAHRRALRLAVHQVTRLTEDNRALLRESMAVVS